MSKINFQFHATQKEIMEMIKTSINKFDLWIISIRLFPTFDYQVISRNQFNDKLDLIASSTLIFLCVSEPNIKTIDYNSFLDENKDCLMITIGENNESILKESSIGSKTDDIEILKIWRTIVNGFKKMMLKGAWVINPKNGARHFYKNHHYTLLAQKEYQNGCQIKPIAGWNVYYLTHDI